MTMYPAVLAFLILLLMLLIFLGLGVYYLFNADKVNKLILGDSPEFYHQYY